MRDPNYKRPGALYIMSVTGLSGFRIGIHSTSKTAREGQVRRGVLAPVSIAWSEQTLTRAHALAAEALAHLYLARYERWRQISGKTIQVFECSMKAATASCKKALKVISSQKE